MTDTDTKVPASTRSRRAPASALKNRPAFVSKLWTMVNDPKNQEYIRWMPDGQSIQVVNREAFEKTILPKHFKHSNFSSFVRQLNMYGWHKVQDVNSGSMHSNDEHWQFQSPNFVRGREDLLDNIVRNKGKHNEEDEEQQAELSKVLSELEQIKSRQIAIGEDLSRIREDNELLWNEYYLTRELYDKHSQMLDRIVRFLASIYGTDGKLLEMIGNQLPGGHRLLMGNESTPGSAAYMPPPSTVAQTTPQIQQLQELQDMQSRIPKTSSSTTRSSPSPTSTGTPPSTDLSKALIPSTRGRQFSQTDLIKPPPIPGASPGGLPPSDLPNLPNNVSNGGKTALNPLPILPNELRRPSTHRLEELEADLANQGNSLKEVQELIQRISPSFGLSDLDMDPNFDVDDFLVNSPLDAGHSAVPGDEIVINPGSEVVEPETEPSPPSKKAKLSS